MLPTFLVVGAEKAGTTTLAAGLSEHPDIFVARAKEVRYFSNHWERGGDWYEAQFDGHTGERAVGEASPSYAHPRHPDAPQRIAETLGRAVKLVYIVRHPVERAISHYRHGMRLGWWPPGTSFEAAIRASDSILGCSRYATCLERFAPFADRAQWRIVVLEDLERTPHAFWPDLLGFLDVDPDFRPAGDARNTAGENTVRPPWFETLVGRMGRTRRLVPAPLRRAAARALSREVPRPALSPARRADLERELLPEVERISAFAGRDLVSLWGIETPSSGQR